MPSIADMGIADVPLRYEDARLDSYRPSTPSQEKALAGARRLAVGEIVGLVLVGPPGVGKTHLAAAAAQAWWERRFAEYEAAWATERQEREAEVARLAPWERIRWRTRRPVSPDWLNIATAISDMRAEIGRTFGEDDYPMVDRLRDIRTRITLAVLDDLGREKISDWTGEAVYVLINGRYEERLPTIVTSNLSPDELDGNGYWACVSRLAEEGALVRIDGPDHRLAR